MWLCWCCRCGYKYVFINCTTRVTHILHISPASAPIHKHPYAIIMSLVFGCHGSEYPQFCIYSKRINQGKGRRAIAPRNVWIEWMCMCVCVCKNSEDAGAKLDILLQVNCVALCVRVWLWKCLSERVSGQVSGAIIVRYCWGCCDGFWTDDWVGWLLSYEEMFVLICVVLSLTNVLCQASLSSYYKICINSVYYLFIERLLGMICENLLIHLLTYK